MKEKRTCFSPEECTCNSCAMPPYRNDFHCGRCGRNVLTVWYCLECKHMMEAEGPDHTDPQAMRISFSWPNPPYKIPFRNLFVCGSCKKELVEVMTYGASFKTGYYTGKPSKPGELSNFVRYEVSGDESDREPEKS